MELLQLRYFMAVMEHMNITKAAKAMFTSQSNISKKISQLESELGVKLFERSALGVAPTDSGIILSRGLSDILPKMENLIVNVQNSGTKIRSTIKAGFCETMDINRILPEFIKKFKIEEPSLNIQLVVHSPRELFEKLSLGEIDLCFMFSMYDIKHPAKRRMAVTRTLPRIYFSKRHPLYKKENLSVYDFSEDTFIQFHIDPVLRTYNYLEHLPFPVKKIIETNSLSAILLYLEANSGVSLLGESQIFLGKETIDSIQLPPDIDMATVGTDAVWLNTNKNPALPVFLSLLSQELKKKNKRKNKRG
ncbi:HTH-type transcriptional regulator CatM [Oxobacter pfennigii]|uniref:HTH-type transcriptional regulator CatM n=1 Tax=Oxobacter pfennigii TaxID=36849 RepID=A0A0N8NTA6_9CLOT|nr:LysR family transcriptional regulator [Oxobacter pfennigii]KPU44296.1 HTH-type transcriptional regulator CatM [Oxobacter pfennigii]